VTGGMRRREFLKNSAMAGAAVLALPSQKLGAQSYDAQIEIVADEQLGSISRNIYGQFTEHIGGVIYDGVWVGENSKIPNTQGIRTKLLDHLKKIHVPVIRWPGGCFADSYDWRDGIGPASARPRRTNFWETSPDAARLHETGPQILENNRFGTNEFVRFCNLSGADPYIAANVRSLTALQLDQWVEYCNSAAGSTSLADTRGAAGFPEPFNVRFWGVGNESWGCGGNFTPEDYATEFRRFTSWVPSYGLDLKMIASGPNGDNIDWTHRFFERLSTAPAYNNPSFFGWSVHFYTAIKRQGKTGDALDFDSDDWYEVLRQGDRMEQILRDHWYAMGQYDRDHRIKLVVDEYGPWYREGTELDPTHIFGQQITIRDALATALTLDTFNRNPDKVAMANNAQLINNINALFLAHEDQFMVTPNFHVFDMYSAHQDSQALRAEFYAPSIHYTRDGRPQKLWGMNGSASRKGNIVTLTVVNPDATNPQLTQIAVRGARVSSASAIILTASDMHAHNTFEHPDAVKPVKLDTSVSSDHVIATLAPASVSKVEIVLGA